MAWWNDSGDAIDAAGGGAAAGGIAGGLLGGPFGAIAGAGWGAAGFPDPTKGWGTNNYRAPGYNPDPNAFVDPYHDANATKYSEGAAAAGARDVGGEFRGDQQGLIDMLQESAAGGGPSAAQELLAAGTEKNLASAASLAGSAATANNPALASRELGYTQAGIAQNVASDAATMRAQEQLAARGQLADVLHGARGQDIQTQGLNDTLVQYYTGLGFANDQAQFAATQALEALRVQEALGQQSINAGAAANDRQFWSQIIGAGLSAGGAAGAAAISDERAKKNVVPGDFEVQQLLDALEAKGFDYRRVGAGAPAGRHVGVMAQDLEGAGPAGAGMVATGPDGIKRIDPGQGFGAVLAAEANLNKRVKALEAGTGATAGAAAGGGMTVEQLDPKILEQPPTQLELEGWHTERRKRGENMGTKFLEWLGVGSWDTDPNVPGARPQFHVGPLYFGEQETATAAGSAG